MGSSYLNREDFHIYKSILYQYPEEDLAIIKHDWETIVNKNTKW